MAADQSAPEISLYGDSIHYVHCINKVIKTFQRNEQLILGMTMVLKEQGQDDYYFQATKHTSHNYHPTKVL